MARPLTRGASSSRRPPCWPAARDRRRHGGRCRGTSPLGRRDRARARALAPLDRAVPRRAPSHGRRHRRPGPGGALWVGEDFAGAMVTLMLASGRLLEARAAARAEPGAAPARRAHAAHGPATRRVPRSTASPSSRSAPRRRARRRHRRGRAGRRPAARDRHVRRVRPDRGADAGRAPDGDDVRSGVVNAGPPVDVVATSSAVRVDLRERRAARRAGPATSAPFVRTADRFAVLFVPLTLALAGAAWAVAGSAAARRRGARRRHPVPAAARRAGRRSCPEQAPN